MAHRKRNKILEELAPYDPTDMVNMAHDLLDYLKDDKKIEVDHKIQKTDAAEEWVAEAKERNRQQHPLRKLYRFYKQFFTTKILLLCLCTFGLFTVLSYDSGPPDQVHGGLTKDPYAASESSVFTEKNRDVEIIHASKDESRIQWQEQDDGEISFDDMENNVVGLMGLFTTIITEMVPLVIIMLILGPIFVLTAGILRGVGKLL